MPRKSKKAERIPGQTGVTIPPELMCTNRAEPEINPAPLLSRTA